MIDSLHEGKKKMRGKGEKRALRMLLPTISFF